MQEEEMLLQVSQVHMPTSLADIYVSVYRTGIWAEGLHMEIEWIFFKYRLLSSPTVSEALCCSAEEVFLWKLTFS